LIEKDRSVGAVLFICALFAQTTAKAVKTINPALALGGKNTIS